MQWPGWAQVHCMWHRQDVTAAVSEHPGEAGHLLSWSHSLCTTKKFGSGWAERYLLLGRAVGNLKLPHKYPHGMVEKKQFVQEAFSTAWHL